MIPVSYDDLHTMTIYNTDAESRSFIAWGSSLPGPSVLLFASPLSYSEPARATKRCDSREGPPWLCTAAARPRTMETVMFRTFPIRTAFALLTFALLAVPVVAAEPSPLEVTAYFLMLSEEQVAHIIALEQAVQENGAPGVLEIAQRQALLGELLESDEPNPAEIGALVLSIRALEQQLVALRQEAADQIREMLDAEQLERLQAAASARPLCPVIPALAALNLL